MIIIIILNENDYHYKFKLPKITIDRMSLFLFKLIIDQRKIYTFLVGNALLEHQSMSRVDRIRNFPAVLKVLSLFQGMMIKLQMLQNS